MQTTTDASPQPDQAGSADNAPIPARMSQWKASGLHLAISLTLASLVFALIYFVWYPQPWFAVAGASTLMLLIMGVDVMIGPLLTLIAWSTTKKRHLLILDLCIIGTLQATAFCYGLFVIGSARPAFVVARIDRFIVVMANEIDDADLAQASSPEFSKRPWFGPKLVGVSRPVSAEEKQKMLFSGLAGKDLEKFPKYYVDYAQTAEQLLTQAKPLEDLAKRDPANARIIDEYLAASGMRDEKLVYLPMQGHQYSQYTLVLSPRTRQPLASLPIDPW